jgi:hypothetical protein
VRRPLAAVADMLAKTTVEPAAPEERQQLLAVIDSS